MDNPEDSIAEQTYGAKVTHMTSPCFSRSAILNEHEWILFRAVHGELSRDVNGHFEELTYRQMAKTHKFAIAQQWIIGDQR